MRLVCCYLGTMVPSVHGTREAPIQIDGELRKEDDDVTVAVLPKALHVLVPREAGR